MLKTYFLKIGKPLCFLSGSRRQGTHFSLPSFQLLIVPAIVGSALLHRLSDDCWEKITAWIYGMGLCALFIVSTVFHIVSWKKSHLRYPGRGTSCAYGHSWLSVFSVSRSLYSSQEGEEWAFSYPTGFERSLSSRHSLWLGRVLKTRLPCLHLRKQHPSWLSRACS